MTTQRQPPRMLAVAISARSALASLGHAYSIFDFRVIHLLLRLGEIVCQIAAKESLRLRAEGLSASCTCRKERVEESLRVP